VLLLGGVGDGAGRAGDGARGWVLWKSGQQLFFFSFSIFRGSFSQIFLFNFGRIFSFLFLFCAAVWFESMGLDREEITVRVILQLCNYGELIGL
jgi:hypothetical protein